MIENFNFSWENEISSENVSDLYFNSSGHSKEIQFECSPDTYPSIVTNIFLAILYALVCIFGIFGNSLVCFVIIKFR